LRKYGLGTSNRIVVSGERRAACAAALASTGASVEVVDEVRAARGRRRVSAVIDGKGATHDCDALVLAGPLRPRDNLARQAESSVSLAGDALSPGCSLEEAEASGRTAGIGVPAAASAVELPDSPRNGIVCLCEDVSAADLELAWFEGFRSTELLKRYTTATMGPCQGALCHSHLQAFVATRLGHDDLAAGPTTGRPPARPL
jgi:NAD(P)H-nitrite reductase large subunit